MTGIELKETEYSSNTEIDSIEETEQEKEKEQKKNRYKPLTDDELHRLFRNEFLTVDDPRYFRNNHNNKRRRKRH